MRRRKDQAFLRGAFVIHDVPAAPEGRKGNSGRPMMMLLGSRFGQFDRSPGK